MKALALLLMLFCPLLSGRAGEFVIRVPGDFADIQGAIDASSDGDTVLVGPGEHVLHAPITFAGKSLTLESEEGAELTVLRLRMDFAFHQRGSVLIFENQEGPDAVVRGFTITGGIGTDWAIVCGDNTEFAMETAGGAILCLPGAGPVIESCIVTENQAENGAGVACIDARPTFVDCRFTKNTVAGKGESAIGSGGGMYCFGPGSMVTLDRCLFEENQADVGGGIATRCGAAVVANRCQVVKNEADYNGSSAGVSCGDGRLTFVDSEIRGNDAGAGIVAGGLSLGAGADVTLLRTTVADNFAAERGGGILVFKGGVLHLLQCTVSRNSSGDSGGVYSSGWVVAEQCRFSSNDGGVGGLRLEKAGAAFLDNCIIDKNGNGGIGGVLAFEGASLHARHCTIAGNSAEGVWAGHGGTVEVENCIIAHNQAQDLMSFGGAIEARFSCIGGEDIFPGEGNINSDPLFLAEDDFHLRPDSPAIDAGGLAWALDRDFDGNARPCGAGPDMGALESGGCKLPTFRRGDVSGDGSLGIADAIQLLGFLFQGAAGPSCPDAADAQDDGALDLGDAVYVLSYLFLGTAAPPEPWPACGVDPTADALTCLGSEACLARDRE